MNLETQTAVETAPAPAPAPRARTWRRAVRLILNNRRQTLLPMLLTQAPFAVLSAGVFFYLLKNQYPDAEFETVNSLAEGPDGIRLWILVITAAQTLFALVGAAATVVVTNALVRGSSVRLVEALDPAFTRMGGLLGLGALYFGLLFSTFLGLVVFIYFIIRLALAVPVFVLEETRVSSALAGSWRLMRGRMWRYIGLFLTVPIVAAVVLIPALIVLTLVAIPFGTDPSRNADLFLFCLSMIVGGTFVSAVYAYLTVATTLFYLAAKEDSGG